MKLVSNENRTIIIISNSAAAYLGWKY